LSLSLLLLSAPALVVAPAQDVQTEAPAPPVVVPAPPPQPQEAPAAPELADPLADPATAAAPPPAGAPGHAKGDPLEGFNRRMFGLHQSLDKAIYRPAAMGYKHVAPKPLRTGLRHFFSNLTEPVAFVNYLLQLKFGKAGRTLVRFTVNSTLGVGGVLDLAKTEGINIPHHDNSFGDTLARYGVGPGPYLFLPLVGPTTLRDLLGGPVDGAVLPVAIGKPFTDWRYQVSSAVIPGLDLRAESDDELRALFAGAADPYAPLRSVWLQNRAAEVAAIRHRKAPPAELDDPMRDPDAPARASDAPELSDPLSDPAAHNPATTPR